MIKSKARKYFVGLLILILLIFAGKIKEVLYNNADKKYTVGKVVSAEPGLGSNSHIAYMYQYNGETRTSTQAYPNGVSIEEGEYRVVEFTYNLPFEMSKMIFKNGSFGRRNYGKSTSDRFSICSRD